jgi:hypothetical protein
MIDIPDRDELNEVTSQGPIITSHRSLRYASAGKGHDPTMAAQN